MNTKLVKHGNSLALVIDDAMLNLLNINEETVLEITVENGKLIVTPKNNYEALDQIADGIMDDYAEVFKKLFFT